MKNQKSFIYLVFIISVFILTTSAFTGALYSISDIFKTNEGITSVIGLPLIFIAIVCFLVTYNKIINKNV